MEDERRNSISRGSDIIIQFTSMLEFMKEMNVTVEPGGHGKVELMT